MTRARTLPFAASFAAWLGACASQPPALEPAPAAAVPRSAAPRAAAAGQPPLASAPFGDLVQQWTATPGNLFVRRPRPDFSAYRSLRLESPEIYYDDREAPPTRQVHDQLLATLRDATRTDAQAAIGLPAGAQSGAGVLRVRSEVSELEFDGSSGVGNSRVTSIVQPGGKALFVLELADDATGEPLLRVALVRVMPGGIFTGPWSPEVDRARQLFRGFTADARDTLGVVFGQRTAQGQ